MNEMTQKLLVRFRNLFKCMGTGHKYFIEEYDKNGQIVATQCFRCGKRVSSKVINV